MADRGQKTVVITGASAGLGAEVARVLARSGHRLALVARREDRLGRVAGEVRALGGEALAIAADLADPSAAASIIQGAAGRFGGVDALVNNAGIGLPDYFGGCEAEALREQVEVNFTAPLLLARHALPLLIESKGVIVNVGSAIVQVANPALGAYGATKAGLAYWSDALGRELRPRGVRVCLVELGPVATEFFDAVGRRDDGDGWIGGDPPPGYVYNAMRDRPPAPLTAPVARAARRVARLIEEPRPRVAMPRRVVWPARLAGAFFRIAPGLADLAISAMVRRVDRERAARRGREERIHM